MPDEPSIGRASEGADAPAPPEDIKDLLRQVRPDDETQLAAFGLLRAYRREALCAVAACVDASSRDRAVARARERLRQRLLFLVENCASDADPAR